MKRSTGLLSVAYAVSQANVLRILYPVRTGALPLQWTMDEATVRRVVDGWAPAERERYRSHLAPDTLHPFIYAPTYIAIERELRGERQRVAGGLFAAAMVTVAACDLVENLHHDRHVRGDITRASARRSGVASRTKWVLAVAGWIRLAQLALTSRGR